VELILELLMRREQEKKNRICINEIAQIATGYEVKMQAINCKYSRTAYSTALANRAVACGDLYVCSGIKRYQLIWSVHKDRKNV
jgi:hypothetical protein